MFFFNKLCACVCFQQFVYYQQFVCFSTSCVFISTPCVLLKLCAFYSTRYIFQQVVYFSTSCVFFNNLCFWNLFFQQFQKRVCVSFNNLCIINNRFFEIVCVFFNNLCFPTSCVFWNRVCVCVCTWQHGKWFQIEFGAGKCSLLSEKLTENVGKLA